jgi:uncharacterized membrane protein
MQTELHSMVVHFPIALLFVAVALELAALYAPWREKLRPAAIITLVVGTLGAAVAVLTGPDENMRGIAIGHTHESMAKITLLLFGILTVWRLYGVRKKQADSAVRTAAFLVVALVGLGVLSYTGWLGGQLVYQHGAGVKVNGQLVAPPAPRGNFPPRK